MRHICYFTIISTPVFSVRFVASATCFICVCLVSQQHEWISVEQLIKVNQNISLWRSCCVHIWCSVSTYKLKHGVN